MKKAFRRNQIVVSALAIMIAVAGYLTYAGKDGTGADSKLYETKEVADNGDTYVAGNIEAADQDLLKENEGNATAAASTENVSSASAENGAAETSAAANQSIAATTAASDQTTAATTATGTSQTTTATDQKTTAAADQSANAGGEASLKDIESLDQDIADTLKNPGEAILTSGLTVADFMAQVKLNREQVRGMNKDALLEVVSNEGISTDEKQNAVDSMVKLTEIADKENAAESLLKAKGFAETIVSIVDGEADVVICKDSLTDAERAQVEDIVKRKTDIGVENIVITLMETNQ